MANQWFKFYGGEYLSDPKIERLTPVERSCWLTILCMASMGENGEIKFLTVESLLNRSGIQMDPYNPEEWERALGVLVKFSNLKMIKCDDDGNVTVINWKKRQEHNLTVAERVAKSRAKKKSVTSNVTSVTTEENRIEENRIDNKRRKDKKEEKRREPEGSDNTLSKVVKFSADDMRLVDLLTELIQQNNPAWKMKGNKETWAEDINKINRIDGMSYKQIEFMIRWTQKDSFWSQNILSAKKLREKFNDLIPKLKAIKSKSQEPNFVL